MRLCRFPIILYISATVYLYITTMKYLVVPRATCHVPRRGEPNNNGIFTLQINSTTALMIYLPSYIRKANFCTTKLYRFRFLLWTIFTDYKILRFRLHMVYLLFETILGIYNYYPHWPELRFRKLISSLLGTFTRYNNKKCLG